MFERSLRLKHRALDSMIFRVGSGPSSPTVGSPFASARILSHTSVPGMNAVTHLMTMPTGIIHPR